MNPYKATRPVSAGAVFYLVLFFLIIGALGYLLYYDKGLFWDYLPIVCIPSLLIALGVIIFYFAKRASIGYTFILFFLIFLTGIVISAFFGPFALSRTAKDSFEAEDYKGSIDNYKAIIEQYPRSRYYDEAVVQLANSYYLDEQYREAIRFFDRSIEQGLLQDGDLEIRKIYTDCYSELGDDSYDSKDFSSASQYYIKASQYYESILLDFPDSNEAFIADYKVPEYKVKAADSLFKTEDFQGAITILENVISQYPDSEFTEQAYSLILSSYFERTGELLSQESYEKALETYLKVLELDEEKIDLEAYFSIRTRNSVFNNVPLYLLREKGYDLYYSEDYKKALFIFEGISQFNPGLMEQFVPYIVSSKVSLVADSDFMELPDSEPVGSISLKDKSLLSIENQTDFILVFYLRGAEYKILEIDPQSRQEIEINSGFYQVLAELENTDVLPFYGKFTYESGARYRELFSLDG